MSPAASAVTSADTLASCATIVARETDSGSTARASAVRTVTCGYASANQGARVHRHLRDVRRIDAEHRDDAAQQRRGQVVEVPPGHGGSRPRGSSRAASWRRAAHPAARARPRQPPRRWRRCRPARPPAAAPCARAAPRRTPGAPAARRTASAAIAQACRAGSVGRSGCPASSSTIADPSIMPRDHAIAGAGDCAAEHVESGAKVADAAGRVGA